ncbi:unnamed protein product [Haemonchus placei]|uniref:ZP domain-containing protein n=1 Tax=Haemonchus placei TaxID=6290 RepID=A0A0N4VTH4_HAEPC|nr:unnamed protein product [Haemonchus placei]
MEDREVISTANNMVLKDYNDGSTCFNTCVVMRSNRGSKEPSQQFSRKADSLPPILSTAIQSGIRGRLGKGTTLNIYCRHRYDVARRAPEYSTPKMVFLSKRRLRNMPGETHMFRSSASGQVAAFIWRLVSMRQHHDGGHHEDGEDNFCTG